MSGRRRPVRATSGCRPGCCDRPLQAISARSVIPSFMSTMMRLRTSSIRRTIPRPRFIQQSQRADPKVLMQLPRAQREILDLVYYHEKSVAEVAQIVGIRPAQSRRDVPRAGRMAELLKGRGEHMQRFERRLPQNFDRALQMPLRLADRGRSQPNSPTRSRLRCVRHFKASARGDVVLHRRLRQVEHAADRLLLLPAS